MQKTKLVTTLLAAMGVSGTANALSVDVNEMIFGGSYAVTGTFNSDPADLGFIESVDPFFFSPWAAYAHEYYAAGTTTTTWTGLATVNGVVTPFSYDINLTGGQVAWGAYFTWSTGNDIPVLVIMDCGAAQVGDVCTGIGTPMVSGPFPGQAPSFNGVVSVADVSTVPVPAAVWLFGSGLVGLAGIARRRKTAKF